MLKAYFQPKFTQYREIDIEFLLLLLDGSHELLDLFDSCTSLHHVMDASFVILFEMGLYRCISCVYSLHFNISTSASVIKTDSQ